MSLNISLNDINILLKALKIAIYRKTFTKEEADQFFTLWSTLTAEFEKLERTNTYDLMYSTQAPS
jgi:hypothetical protein